MLLHTNGRRLNLCEHFKSEAAVAAAVGVCALGALAIVVWVWNVRYLNSLVFHFPFLIITIQTCVVTTDTHTQTHYELMLLGDNANARHTYLAFFSSKH
uniref:Uncharacterized protein n=1 Tax=Anopheles darlingi TaxID=43151 RepID=A0A2M4CUV4_ANODA